MTTTPNATPEAPTSHRGRMRRLGSALVAAGAVTVGGVATLPAGVAEAAGVIDRRVQQVATTPEASDTAATRSVAARGALDPRRPTMRVRVTPNGDVIPS